MLVTDNIGSQSSSIKQFGGKREVASSEDVELEEFMGSIEPDDTEVNKEPITQQQVIDDGNSFIQNVGEVFPAIGGGLIKATQELGNLAIDGADWAEDFAAKKGFGDGDIITDKTQLSFADDPSLVYQPESFGGKMISSVAQFIGPFAGFDKAAKGVKVVSKIAKFAKAGAIGAAVDFAAFDPHEERLSNLVQHFPSLKNPVTEFLASNPKDTKAEGRFKNAIEGIGLGLVSEGFFKAVKVIRQQRVAKNVLKDTEDLSRAIEEKGLSVEPEAPVLKEGETAPPVTDAPPELPKEVLDAKAELKTQRPTQELVEGIPEPPKNFITTADEADEVLKGFEDVKIEGKAANINLSKIETVDDVKKMIKKVSELDAKPIEDARRGVITDKEVSGLADELGMSIEDLLSRREGQAFSAEQVIASRRILNASADNLVKISKKISAGDDSKVMAAQFSAALDQHRVIQAEMSGITAEAGRALRAFNQNIGLDNATQNRFLDDLLRQNGGRGEIGKLAEQLAGADTATVSRLARKSLGRKLKDAANEVFVNNLLSGPKTHLVNMMSNLSVGLTGIPERFIAEQISGGTVGSVAKGETAALMAGGMNGWIDSLRMAKEAFKTGNSQFTKSTKIELPYEKSLSARAFGIDEETVLGKAMNFMGYGMNIPTKLLESSDEFFKAMNYRMEVHAQAHRQGMNKQLADGLSDAETAELIAKLTQNPDETIKMSALDKARENTFTKPLGDLKLRGLDAESIDAAIKGTPVMRVVAPFTKTNLNLVEFALNRTPFAKGLLGDIRAGGLRKDTALGRVAFGTATGATIAALVPQGLVTGKGPSDIKARRALEASGWKPYSIKVGNTFMAYNKLDPFGSVMGMAADSAELISALSAERDSDAQALALQFGSIVASLMTPEFLTRNVNDFIDVINGDEKKAERFFGNVARGAVPFSSFARSLRPALDNIQRDKRADPNAAFPVFEKILNELRDTIPFMSDSLPPKRNIFGEAQAFMPLMSNPDDATPVQTDTNDAISKEIQRLNMVGPAAINGDEGLEYLKIDMPERYIRKSFAGQSNVVKLSPEQYDRYVMLSSGNEELENNPFGSTLREALSTQVKNNYPLLGNNNKTDDAKRLVIKEIIKMYRSSAKQQMMLEDGDIEEKFIEQMEIKSNRLTGENVNLSL